MDFNRHMMVLLRDSRGVTQSDLAKSLSVRQSTISKYEAGILVPPEGFINELAGVLKYRPSFFYEAGQPYGLPPFHFRKRKKLSVKALAKIVAEINIRRIQVAKLLRSYGHLTKSFIPEIDRDEYVGTSRKPFSIEEVAAHARAFWGLDPARPVPNLVDLIEENGGIVIPCDFGTELIDAVSQRVDGLPVMFFININAPADRIRHTLAHELGHMMLHTSALISDDEMELEADAFAGAFLLPAREMRLQLRHFSLRQVANMKRHWQVSMQAIAVRAERLGVITKHQSKMFFIEMSRLRWKKNEPHEPPKEKPRLLRAMIDYHLCDLDYSMSELAALFGMRKDEVADMYRDHYFAQPKKPMNHLRLVTS